MRLFCGFVLFALSLSSSLAGANPVVIHVDEDYAEDGVTPTNPVAILSPEEMAFGNLPPWIKDAATSAVTTLRQVVGGMFADPRGVEYPRVTEPQPGEFVFMFGKSRVGLALQGAGALKLLGEPFYYQEVQGTVGVEYNFISPTHPDLRLAIRLSPLHGELALIRTGAGARKVEGLPARPVLGPSAGIEASKTLGPAKFGARAYTRYLWDLMNTDDQGTSIYGALYCRIQLNQLMDKKGKASQPTVYLTPTLAFFDRGMSKAAIDRWDGKALGAFRSYEDIRKFWEATVLLEVLSF